MPERKGAADLVAEARATAPQIDAAEARRRHGRAVFLDVREPDETARGTIPGAVVVPRGLLEFAADPALPTRNPALDPEAEVVVYCASGGRSALAAKTLAEMGYRNVANLAGGYAAWTEPEGG